MPTPRSLSVADFRAYGRHHGIAYRFPRLSTRSTRPPDRCPVVQGRVEEFELSSGIRLTSSDIEVLQPYESTSLQASPLFIVVILQGRVRLRLGHREVLLTEGAATSTRFHERLALNACQPPGQRLRTLTLALSTDAWRELAAREASLATWLDAPEARLHQWRLPGYLTLSLGHGLGNAWQGSQRRLLLEGLALQLLAHGLAGPVEPVPGAAPIALFPPTREEHDLSQTGVYLQDQMAFGNWHLTLGGRYDWVEITNTNRDSGATSELDDTQFSGRAGLLYRFDNGLSPYVSYSTAFTPTSFTDAEGDLLEPMQGRQIETGLKYQPPGTADRYSLSLFRINQENVATKEQPTDPYPAIGEIESQGVELEAHTRLTERLRLQAGYGFTDITYKRSDDGHQGNRAVYAPRHQASLWGHYRFDGGLDAGLGVRYHADIQADRANTRQVPDYTLVDATLGYDLGRIGLEGVSARLNVGNLLDEEYVAACNSLEFCYFGVERSVLGTLSYTF